MGQVATLQLGKESDEKLVQIVVNSQNEKAISHLYDRYSTKIFSRCISFVKDREIAEDLTHDVFMKILLSLASFKGNSKFSTWVYSITYNYCIDYLRKRKKIRLQQNDYENSGAADTAFDDIENLAELQEMKVTRLIEILEQVNTDEKMILMMKYRDGLSIKHIQRIFDLSESAVKMRLKRAKDKVKKFYLKKYKNDF